MPVKSGFERILGLMRGQSVPRERQLAMSLKRLTKLLCRFQHRRPGPT
jgi:hypothetical protein